MTTLTRAESRRLYSWWWDSHIPKNSKWLQENLADIDIKIKAMIKLIEEDADSFARRAEMYYRKRPELMKLVEEFYRAYRALAERYDHATGALRQAHRTMAEAFPNQIPFELSEESLESYATETASHTAETSPQFSEVFDDEDSQKDDSSLSLQYQFTESEACSEKNLKQFNDMFRCGEETICRSAGRRARKGLNFQDEERNMSDCKVVVEEVSQLSTAIQNLKSHITSESMRADTAEAEVRSLKETICQLNSEKETARLQNQFSQEKISKMQTEISHSKDDFKKLNDEMLMVMRNLKSAEEHCLLLQNHNQSLQLELSTSKQKENEEQEEIKKLKSLLQEEHIQLVQAKTAHHSLEKLQSHSSEDMSEGFEGANLKGKNGSKDEKLLAFALDIINLQDEIIFLKDSKVTLADEFRLQIEEKRSLQQELSCLKEDKNDLEQSCHRLAEQVETVNSNVESLQLSVKELQNENEELKEICKKHENEKVINLENLKCMEKISEKNVVLENSLSDANLQIEDLRKKINTVEEFCEYLCGKISLHQSEKAALISQIENISRYMEKLSERNTSLEKSLCDANIELEGLRGKLTVLQESHQSIYAKKSNPLSEKSIVISQAEGATPSLENLLNSHGKLNHQHSNLERGKILILQEVAELEDSMKQKKEEDETFLRSVLLSNNPQLSSLENQIRLLQNKYQLREEEFEAEQYKIMDSQIEIFILQRCLYDMNERNSIQSVECQKLAEASHTEDKANSELKLELLTQNKKLSSSEEHNEKLREGIQLMLKEICPNKHCVPLCGTDDDLLLKLTLHEIRELLISFSSTLDENQHLLLEKTVIITILGQFGLNVVELTMHKNLLEQDSKNITEELLLLESQEFELLVMNEQFGVDVLAGNQREEVLKAEIEVLCERLRDFKEAYRTSQSEICKLLEENQTLSKKLYELKEKKEILEEENNAILAEAITLENLYLIFRSSTTEKILELQSIMNDVSHFQEVRYGLDKDIELLTENLRAVEVENVCLKETVGDLGECHGRLIVLGNDLNATRNICRQSNLEIESGKDLLLQKEIELFQANQKLLDTQSKNTELCSSIEGLHLDLNETSALRKELEHKIFRLAEDNAHKVNEISRLNQENGRLNWEHGRSLKEVEYLRNREESLTSELHKGEHEINTCESEIATLLNDIQITRVDASVFEEKVRELLITCENLEISSMVQRGTFHEEIILRTADADELKEKVDTVERENIGLKEDLNKYFLLLTSLNNDVASLEEQMISLAKHCTMQLKEKKDNQLVSLQRSKSCQGPSEFHSEIALAGILELQKLHAKVKGLHKVVIETGTILEQEIFGSNDSSDDGAKHIDVLKSKGHSSREEGQISKYIMQLENTPECGIDKKLKKGVAGNSTMKYEQMMKDIQLDLVVPSQCGNNVGSHRSNMLESARNKNNYQDLDLWVTTGRDCSNQMQEASSSTTWHDVEYQQIEVVEEERNQCPSSGLGAENELSGEESTLDKKATDSIQDWHRRVTEGLSSDAQRLLVLQTSMEELKGDVETTEMNNCPASSELDKVKVQLKDAEGSIWQFININNRLTKKAEYFSASPEGEQREIQDDGRRQVSEHAQRLSEKIGKLELEVHKIQYILLKLKEETEIKELRVTDKRKFMLSDYLYRRTERRRKKRGPCQCMRPKTRDD